MNTPRMMPVERADPPDLSDFEDDIYVQLRRARFLAQPDYRWKYFGVADRQTGYPSGFLAQRCNRGYEFLGRLPFRASGHRLVAYATTMEGMERVLLVH